MRYGLSTMVYPRVRRCAAWAAMAAAVLVIEFTFDIALIAAVRGIPRKQYTVVHSR